ncbi:MAG TPA: hypothetical protein VLG16_00820 [Candidatus Saccharimonadales bacterium]|nr:hypothetical protein [Candidatus Saccharimonadales bacterium]
MKHSYTIFAQAYGQGSYGNCTYNDATTCTSSGSGSTGTASGSGGTLTNTGFDILLVVTVACALIFIALVARLWRKKNTKIAAIETIEVEADDGQPRQLR